MASQLQVLGHDGHSLGVNGGQVSVLEEASHVGLGGFLQGQNSGTLEAEIHLEVLRHLSAEALERQLADQQVRGLLVLADLAEGHGPRSVSVRLLDSSRENDVLASHLGGELLTRSLASDGLAGSLLGTGHFVVD